MTATSLKFDEIGDWSELKLEIVEEYGRAYTTAFKNSPLKKYYIDAFSGAGVHVSKRLVRRLKAALREHSGFHLRSMGTTSLT